MICILFNKNKKRCDFVSWLQCDERYRIPGDCAGIRARPQPRIPRHFPAQTDTGNPGMFVCVCVYVFVRVCVCLCACVCVFFLRVYVLESCLAPSQYEG